MQFTKFMDAIRKAIFHSIDSLFYSIVIAIFVRLHSMTLIPRHLAAKLASTPRTTRVITTVGPRQTGKTTLVRDIALFLLQPWKSAGRTTLPAVW